MEVPPCVLRHRHFSYFLLTFTIIFLTSTPGGALTSKTVLRHSNTRGIVTSSYSVQRWASVDWAKNLQKFIDHEEFRLKVISNNFSAYEKEVPFVKQRLSEFKIIHKDLVKNATLQPFQKSLRNNHPTTIFVAIRNFVATWEDKLANRTIYGKRLREFLEANGARPLPTRNDLHTVGTAITVIQATYNLSMAELIKGQVLGHQGEPLSSADCYDIGKTVLRAGLLETAKEWLEMAISGIDLATVDLKSLTFNMSDALTHLAKVAHAKKDQNKALTLFEKAVELDPDNLAVYQEYVKHRFGRDVEPLNELNREKVEPWRKKFFDMCHKSTKSSLMEQPKKLQKTLKCRLRPVDGAPFSVFKEEILSRRPFISLIYNFVGNKEIKDLKNSTLDKLKNIILPGNDPGILWQNRAGWFRDHVNHGIGQISKRVGDITGLDVRQQNHSYSLGEPMHVIDFGVAGLALPHAEYLRKYKTDYMRLMGRGRFMTAQVYLSDVTLGGATVFIKQDLTILPKKGMAVLWYNYKPCGHREWNLYPAICPLAVGENIVLEKGVFRLNDDPKAMCGPKMKSSHLMVERALACNAGKCVKRNPKVEL